jgi:hypothetical protein
MRFWQKRNNIPKDDKVGICLVTYDQTDCLQGLIFSLKCQTFKNFVVVVVHDGEWTEQAKKSYENSVGNDDRFIALNSEKRLNKFGHNNRQFGFDVLKNLGCNWFGTMNGDSYYVPIYFEYMLSKACEDKSNFVFCNMVHSHRMWTMLDTKLDRSYIDGGCFLANINLIEDTKWDSLDFAADWYYVSKLKDNKNFKSSKIDSCLFVHN